MHEIPIPARLDAHYFRRGKVAPLVLGGLVAVGAISFLALLRTDPGRAWQSYVSNWLFFTSVAQGAVILYAATVITKARWNWSVRRISLSLGAFLPISFLLLLPMLGLRENYFPWLEMMAEDEILQQKAAYLNIPFLMARQAGGALLLFTMSLIFVYWSLRPDLGPEGAAEAGGDAARARWRARLSGKWLGQEREEDRSWAKLTVLAPPLVLTYAVVMSMFAVDWAMSLDPHWLSTLFPAWFFMGAFWSGIASTALLSVLLKKTLPYADKHIGPQQLHDLGQLTFAYSIFWTYTFWSQYLVIWYGKLPWEQEWMVQRSGEGWGRLSLLVIVLCFVVPFASLIGRAPKKRPGWLGAICVLILGGLWLERFLLIAPSLHQPGQATITFWEPLIGLGFLGLFGTAVRWFLVTFPIIQLWQPKPLPEMTEAELPVGSR
ncbi:MAG: hypothetical protein EXR92_04755 [Gemmatimonadetes bacterium]|nr:hypothetical protein [Gemmatimonadota bacterium]